VHGDSGDSAGAPKRSREWLIVAGMLAGGVVVYGALAYALYAVISTML
jgi:hypothetical protein